MKIGEVHRMASSFLPSVGYELHGQQAVVVAVYLSLHCILCMLKFIFVVCLSIRVIIWTPWHSMAPIGDLDGTLLHVLSPVHSLHLRKIPSSFLRGTSFHLTNFDRWVEDT